jgi:5-dehydro-2-deoxygluconokinase
VLANDEELYILTGEREGHSQVNIVTTMGVNILVRKLGANGAEVCTKNDNIVLPPCRGQTLCTIGAGDGFAAGFLYALHRQMGLEDCLKYGNAAAAVVVSRVSCSDAMPHLQEIEDCLQQGDKFKLYGHKQI